MGDSHAIMSHGGACRDDFEYLDVLGEGSSGVVYKARRKGTRSPAHHQHDYRSDEYVAIKMVRRHLLPFAHILLCVQITMIMKSLQHITTACKKKTHSHDDDDAYFHGRWTCL
jgi:hypothetical protein